MQLRRPHIVEILLEGVGVCLQSDSCKFLSPRNSCIDLCFDICGRDYHGAAGAVVEQLAQDTLADDSDANAAPLRPGRHILELAQGERAWE